MVVCADNQRCARPPAGITFPRLRCYDSTTHHNNVCVLLVEE